jgi:hypothetical protein
MGKFLAEGEQQAFWQEVVVEVGLAQEHDLLEVHPVLVGLDHVVVHEVQVLGVDHRGDEVLAVLELHLLDEEAVLGVLAEPLEQQAAVELIDSQKGSGILEKIFGRAPLALLLEI